MFRHYLLQPAMLLDLGELVPTMTDVAFVHIDRLDLHNTLQNIC